MASYSIITEKLATASTRIELESIAVPTFVLNHSFPFIAVVGAFRPRLFIANHVIDSLSEEELAAAIAHEYGHLAARRQLQALSDAN